MAQFVGVKSHSILLLDNGKDDKEWSSHPSFDSAVDHVIKMFEKQLEQMNQQQSTIQYTVSDLENFVRSFNDMTVMVLDGSTLQYQGVSTDKLMSGMKSKLTRDAGY